jgi:NAD(P)-dependent dehydrogenase (short-subunit alcohol dehydrogenase family)
MSTIFITGASTGLGRATALLFAQKGWKVIATMRTPEKETELATTPNVSLMQLDVTDPEQITEVAAKALATGPVDVVFNNAGYGLIGPLEGISDEQIVQQVNTNLLGVIRVTKAFIPAFRERKKGMFIATTSIGGLITYPFGSMYHATKWALEGWSESFSFEMSVYGIGVKTVSPGGINTDFMSRSMVMAKHDAYEEALQRLFKVYSQPERAVNRSSAEQIAAVVYEAATDGKDQLRYVAGADANMMYAKRLAEGPELFRKNVASAFLPG